MPGLALAQVRFQRTSQKAEDVVINTFHFSYTNSPPLSSGLATAIAARCAAMYNTIVSGNAVTLASRMGDILATTGHSVRVYDLADAPPRVPKVDTAFTIAAPAGSSLPAEVCLVMSLRATPVSGVPAAYKRGRAYIGPLSSSGSVIGTTAAGDVRPVNTFMTLLANCGKALAQPIVSGADTGQLVVYSPTSGLASPVTLVRVNDAFDTQRRRGADPTLNTDVAV